MMQTYKTQKIDVDGKIYEFEYRFDLKPRREFPGCKIKDVIEGAECEILSEDRFVETPESLKSENIWSVGGNIWNLGSNFPYQFVFPKKR